MSQSFIQAATGADNESLANKYPDPAKCTQEHALQLAKDHYTELFSKQRIEQPDPFYQPGSMFAGEPAYCKIDTSRQPASEIDALVHSMEGRLTTNEARVPGEPGLTGADLRARNLEWWLASLSPEEYPYKVGKWQDVRKARNAALKKTQALAFSLKPLKPRKRTAFFGLADMPVIPELEKTSALIYAVRLGRVGCLRALLDCAPPSKGAGGNGGLLDARDRFGHTATEYAAWLLARDARKPPELQFMLDTLLMARPSLSPADDVSGGSKASWGGRPFPYAPHNVLDPLCLAVVAYDLPRIAWLVKQCGAPINRVWMFAPDIPAYLEGKWEKMVGSWDARVGPLHLALLHKRFEIVRLLLDLGANPNLHGFGIMGPAPHKARINFLDLLAKARSNAKRKLSDADVEAQASAWRVDEVTKTQKKVDDAKNSLLNAFLNATAGKLGAKATAVLKGAAGIILSIKKLIESLLFGHDTWVSALHLAGRLGAADCTMLLLSRGAAPNGGKISLLARRTPLEEALVFARDNFKFDHKDAQRHNWDTVKEPAWDMPGYSVAAAAGKAKAAAVAVMSNMDPITLSMKAVIATAKVVIDMVISSIRRPIAHFDPALATAHVLLRAGAQPHPSDTQTITLVRDLMDTGRWAWVGPVVARDDVEWVTEAADELVKMRTDKNHEDCKRYDFHKIGVTKDYKEHDKLVIKYKSKAESRYLKIGSKGFYDAYKRFVQERAKAIKSVAVAAAHKALEAYAQNLTAAVSVRGVLEMRAMEQAAQMQAQAARYTAAISHGTGGLYSEDVLKSGKGLAMATFDLADAAQDEGRWATKSFRVSTGGLSRGSSSALLSGLTSGPSVSRLSVLAAARSAKSGRQNSVAVALQTMQDLAAGGMARSGFVLPRTAAEEGAAGADPLGPASADACRQRREALELSDLSSMGAQLKEAAEAVKRLKADAQRHEEGLAAGNEPDNQHDEDAEALSKFIEDVQKKMDEQEGKEEVADVEADLDVMDAQGGEDVDGMMEQMEMLQDTINTILDFVDNM